MVEKKNNKNTARIFIHTQVPATGVIFWEVCNAHSDSFFAFLIFFFYFSFIFLDSSLFVYYHISKPFFLFYLICSLCYSWMVYIWCFLYILDTISFFSLWHLKQVFYNSTFFKKNIYFFLTEYQWHIYSYGISITKLVSPCLWHILWLHYSISCCCVRCVFLYITSLCQSHKHLILLTKIAACCYLCKNLVVTHKDDKTKIN